jgi:hypothetical protein
MTAWYSIVYHIFFIHSSINGHLGCFHVFTTVNLGVRYLCEILISFPSGRYEELGLLDYTVVPFLIFLTTPIFYFPKWLHQFISTNGIQGYPFPHIHTNICYCLSVS